MRQSYPAQELRTRTARSLFTLEATGGATESNVALNKIMSLEMSVVRLQHRDRFATCIVLDSVLDSAVTRRRIAKTFWERGGI
jgi:hypothetical protein